MRGSRRPTQVYLALVCQALFLLCNMASLSACNDALAKFAVDGDCAC